MGNTYHKIYIQTIFAVKHRQAFINPEWEKDLYAVIGTIISEKKGKLIISNGVEDHIHSFFSVPPVVSVSDMMQAVKGKSSKFINGNKLTSHHFEWQAGYGVFSYGQSQVDSVYHYIKNQKEHHKKQNFKDEYIRYLKNFKIDYDEKYILEDLGNENGTLINKYLPEVPLQAVP